MRRSTSLLLGLLLPWPLTVALAGSSTPKLERSVERRVQAGRLAPSALRVLQNVRDSAAARQRSNFGTRGSHAVAPRSAAGQLKQTIEKNEFDYLRPLAKYRTSLPPSFGARLGELGASDTWMDAGAGLARAQQDYLDQERAAQREAPRLVAISAKAPTKEALLSHFYRYPVLYSVPELKRSTPARERRLLAQNVFGGFRRFVASDKVTYAEGYVEKTPLRKLAPPGSVALLTDLMGPMAYSLLPHRVLSTYHRLLRPGGVAYLMGSRTKVHVEGEWKSLERYLANHTRGFDVAGEKNEAGRSVIVLKKNGDALLMPRLHLQKIEELGPPPTGLFQVAADGPSRDARPAGLAPASRP